MRSQRGFLAALVLFLALPITVLYQILVGGGADTVVHVMLATGSLLLAAPALKLLYLLPFVWLFFESNKKISSVHSLKVSLQEETL